MTTGNLPAASAPLPTIQLYAQSLGPQERFKHRAFIGVRVEALLDPYWDKRPSDAVKDEILRDWMETLENYAPDEIRAACHVYLAGDSRKRKPKPGDIRALCIDARAVAMRAAKAAEPVAALPVPTADEDAAEIARRKAFSEEVLRKVFRAEGGQ